MTQLLARDVKQMVRQAGFEPTTPAFGGQYSIHLSYWRDFQYDELRHHMYVARRDNTGL